MPSNSREPWAKGVVPVDPTLRQQTPPMATGGTLAPRPLAVVPPMGGGVRGGAKVSMTAPPKMSPRAAEVFCPHCGKSSYSTVKAGSANLRRA